MRPFTRAAVAGLAAHVFLELGAGVGMPGASLAGPWAAGATWAGGSVALWWVAGRCDPRHDTLLAAADAVGLAAVAAHLGSWPRRRTRAGLPLLLDCEGLGRELMPVYNALLYASGAAALGGLLRENRTASRTARILPLALAPALGALQHAEHRRLRRLARTRPGWWNRRLEAAGPDTEREVCVRRAG